MRVASTPVDVERTFERRAMRASVLGFMSEWAVKGSWVALSEAMVSFSIMSMGDGLRLLIVDEER